MILGTVAPSKQVERQSLSLGIGRKLFDQGSQGQG